MRKQRANLGDAIGTDSFLDIVANLVGILVILLMVIGVRMEDASQAVQEVPNAASMNLVAPEPLSLPKIEMPDVEAAQLAVNRIESSIREAHQEANRLASLIKVQKLDRDNLMVAIAKAERILKSRREDLDEQQKSQLSSNLDLQRAEEEYKSILAKIESVQLEIENQKPEVLQHVATPMAKTVFVREEHFRLQDEKLLYVPLNEMTSRLRTEAPKKTWKLERSRQITETIGPYQGFEMRYTLRRNRLPFRTESGVRAARDVVELDRFVMIPVGNVQGESVAQALEPTSAFRSRLADWDPRETIITVWVYPESFSAFRELKSKLYELGYLSAARPLPAKQLISGSPQGTRSAAQ